MKRAGKILVVFIVSFFYSYLLRGQEVVDTLFYEAFLSSSEPAGWTQERINFTGSDLRWRIAQGVGISGGLPNTAKVGGYNYSFYKQGNFSYVTKLITPPIIAEGGNTFRPELRFWHAQRTSLGNNDELKVYYRHGRLGEWAELMHYQSGNTQWEQRSLLLPQGMDTTYIAFEGITNWAGGVVIDEVQVLETEVVEMFLSEVITQRPTTARIAAGTNNNPVSRSRLLVLGNSGEFRLNRFTVHSDNTSDDDLLPNGVKLYLTQDVIFNTNFPVGEGTDFVNGVATFEDLDLVIPRGYSYIWVTYDVKEDAGNLHKANSYIPQYGVSGSSGDELPAMDQNPMGHRIIYRTIFYDDFETDKGWELSGEFEIDVPLGRGGSNEPGGSGNPGPSNAFVGTKVLGTDIAEGMGMYPGNYEPNLEEKEWTAVSPSFDCTFFTEVNLSYHRWLNVHYSGYEDKVSFDVSIDGGITWEELWRNDYLVGTAIRWSEHSISLPMAERQPDVRIRFTLGPTSSTFNHSGWHIDNLMITGNFITRDTGVTGWLYPNSGCGLSDQEQIAVTVENFAIEPTPANLPIGFSLDGGETWHMDVVAEPIESGESITHIFSPRGDFSQPGNYQVIARTFLEDDQSEENDAWEGTIFSVPTYTRPYATDFSENGSYWTPAGPVNSWEWGTPSGILLSAAHSGENAWTLNADGTYASNEISWLESPCFSFEGNDYTVLEFMLHRHTDADDGLALQYSVNDGASWQLLDVFQDTLTWNWYNREDISNLANTFGSGKGWSGITEHFQQIRMVLPPLIANYPRVKFRLVFAGGENTHFEGVIFDSFEVYQAPPDVGITALVNPENDCTLSESQKLTVEVYNFGINTLPASTTIPIALEVNEASTVYENFVTPEPINPGESKRYTFDASFNMTEPGNYEILAYTMLPGDSGFYFPGESNDELQTTVTVFGFPEPSLGDDIYTTMPDTLVLQTTQEYVAYLWQDGSDNPTFDVTELTSQTYSVTVTDENTCQATATVDVFTWDLMVSELISPSSYCELTETEIVRVKLTNEGLDVIPAGKETGISLYLDGQLITSELHYFEEALHPDDSFTHTFETTLDMRQERVYEIRISHDLSDGGTDSNELITEVSVFGYPEFALWDDIYTLQADTLVIDAGDEYAQYLWHDGSTERFYTPHENHTAVYWVEVLDFNGCSATGYLNVFAHDLDIQEFTTPTDTCLFETDEPIAVRIANSGPGLLGAGAEVTIKLAISGEAIAEDWIILEEDFLPGESMVHVFSQSPDMTAAGTYPLFAYHTYPDGNPANDELNHDAIAYGYPDIVIPHEIVTHNPTMVIVDGGEEHNSWLWSDGSEDQFFQPEDFGTYSLTVTNVIGCESWMEFMVVPIEYDFKPVALVSPGVICAESQEVIVEMEIKNNSNVPVDEGVSLQTGYRFNQEQFVTENIFTPYELLPGETFVHTFSQTIDQLGDESWAIKIWTSQDLDENPQNDTLWVEREVLQLPDPFGVSDIYTLAADTLVLDAGADHISYEWHDGSQDRYFHVGSLQSQTYSVIVEDLHGCISYNELTVNAFDLNIAELKSPDHHCDLPENPLDVTVSLTNSGHDILDSGSELPIHLYVNGEQLSTNSIILASDLLPGDTIDFTFEEPFMPETYGIYDITIVIEFMDANPENNTLTKAVHFNEPIVVDLGNDIYTLQPDTLVIDAGDEYTSYLWQDGSEEQYFIPSAMHSAVYSVMVTDEFGCQGIGSIQVNAFDYSLDEILAPASTCTLTTAENIIFSVSNTGLDTLETGRTVSFILQVGEDQITEEAFQLPAQLLPGASETFTSQSVFDFSTTGNHLISVSLAGIDADSSNNTVQNTITLSGLPMVDLGPDIFTQSPDTVVLDAGAGFASYLWQDGSDDRYFHVQDPMSATYSVTVTDEYGCEASGSVNIISNHFVPVSVFAPLSNCTLPEDQQVIFSMLNNSPNTIPQGSHIPFAIITDSGDLTEEEHITDAAILPGDAMVITSQTTFDFSATGTYELMIVFSGQNINPTNDTLYHTFSVTGFPEVDLGEDIYTTRADTLLLDAGDGFNSYLWQDGNTHQYYTPTELHSATYTVTVTDQFNCQASGSVSVYAYDLAIGGVHNPSVPVCGLPSGPTNISILITNSGHDVYESGLEIPVALFKNDILTEEVHILQTDLLPGQSAIHVFDRQFFVDEYYISRPATIYHGLSDVVKDNDTLHVNFEAFPPIGIDLGPDIYSTRPDTLVIDAGAGYASYHWNNGSEGQYFTPDKLYSATYTVTVYSEDGCAATDSIRVHTYDFKPLEVLSPQSNCVIPEPEKIVFSVLNNSYDTIAPGTQIPFNIYTNNYEWSSELFVNTHTILPGENTIFTSLTSFDFTQTGNHILNIEYTGIDANPQNDLLVTQIEVTGLPQVNLGQDIVTLKPDTVVLDAGPGFASYLWQDNITHTQHFDVQEYGVYWVEVEDQWGCSATDTIEVRLTTGINQEVFARTIKAYPNPAEEYLFLELQGWKAGKQIELSLSDISGNLINNQDPVNLTGELIRLHVGHLNPGVYFLQVKHSYHQRVIRFIKK